MYTYLIINLAIIIFPLLFSFEKQIKFYRNWRAVFISIGIVGSAYIIWDIIFTARGVWSFNTDYLIGVNIIGLPLEEILFFVTVPFSAAFTYEIVKLYLKDKIIEFKKDTFMSVATLFLFAALWFWREEYTVVVLASCGLFFILAHYNKESLVKSVLFWKTVLIIYIPFLIVNYLLTSLPVVTYNDLENIGFRITTIPLEDFFYSFSLISFSLFFYERFKTKS